MKEKAKILLQIFEAHKHTDCFRELFTQAIKNSSAQSKNTLKITTNFHQHQTVAVQTSARLPAAAPQGCCYPTELLEAKGTHHNSTAARKDTV